MWLALLQSYRSDQTTSFGHEWFGHPQLDFWGWLNNFFWPQKVPEPSKRLTLGWLNHPNGQMDSVATPVAHMASHHFLHLNHNFSFLFVVVSFYFKWMPITFCSDIILNNHLFKNFKFTKNSKFKYLIIFKGGKRMSHVLCTILWVMKM